MKRDPKIAQGHIQNIGITILVLIIRCVKLKFSDTLYNYTV